ncbi:MAG TPA: hypothetical protein VFF69_07905 [Phycisphaerales bacterium]|nr:hypothetical protein [Phycisphaerales bacterium]
MSRDLRRLVEGQLEQLSRLVADHRDGIEAVLGSSPGLWEREALGTALHSF